MAYGVDGDAPGPVGRALDLRLEEARLEVLELSELIPPVPRNKTVRDVCGDLRLAASFARDSVDQMYVADFLGESLLRDRPYVDAFDNVRAAAKEFGACLTAIDNDDNGELFDILERLAGELRRRLKDVAGAFVAVVDRCTMGQDDLRLAPHRAKALSLAGKIQNQLSARQFSDEAKESSNERKKKKKDAADEMVDRLGSYYGKYADGETHTANWLRLIAAGLLAMVAAGTLGLHIWLGVTSFSLNTELVRLSATIPVAGLAVYFAREAAKHRESARGARELAIAMHTLPGYTKLLEADDERALRLALGMRVFGSATNQLAAPEQDGSATLTDRMHSLTNLIGTGATDRWFDEARHRRRPTTRPSPPWAANPGSASHNPRL